MQFLSLRAVFLLGFVVAMPVMALPAVARRIDELLYGAPKAGVEHSLDSRPPPTQSLRSAAGCSVCGAHPSGLGLWIPAWP